ncbi:nucleic acid/nucleotide deaminase domain-containing protein [Streptomyces chattanoogensis]|uniref:nucleic acid/nucleotide deaminase domain-containing protein n=1 Tax=Streptomyces chattanoogensis TaxID=66876 RepID=UPI003686B81B
MPMPGTPLPSQVTASRQPSAWRKKGNGKRAQSRWRARRLMTAVVALTAVIAPLPTETLPPAYALPAAAAKPPMPDDWGQIPLYDHPISQFGYDVRKKAGMASPDKPEALYRNAAVGFVDMTSEVDKARHSDDPEKALAELSKKYGGFQIREASASPDLFAALGLDPEVTALLVVPRLNNPLMDNSDPKRPTENPGALHAEMELLRTLRKQGIPWERLLALWSERSPCRTGRSRCYQKLLNYAPHVKIFFSLTHQSWKGGDAEKINAELKKGLRDEGKRRAEMKSAPDPKAQATVDSAFTPGTVSECQTSGLGEPRPRQPRVLTAAYTRPAGSVRSAAYPCGEDEPDGNSGDQKPSALAKMLGMPESDPGGIDFSSLNLRYLSDTGSAKTGLRYSMGAAPVGTGGAHRRSDGVKAVAEASDAFFVWLSLRPSAFWVNLNPTEPDRIVDSAFGRTDAGRILLQADLRMKKTIAQLIHPDTTLGADYWGRIQGKCMSMRTWIVPGEAKVHATPDELYIMDAPLKVKMETQYLREVGAGGTKPCTQEKSAEKHNESLFRSMILPKVEKAVNTAPEYAELRRVYLSRVAAEWYRDVSRRKNVTYSKFIDRGDVSRWTTKSDWKPRDTFDAYVDSYKKGEFKVTRRTTKGTLVYQKTYVFGGVDLTNVPFHKVDDGRFKAEWPHASTNVNRSWDRPVRDAGGSERILLLSGGPSPSAARQAADEQGFSRAEFVDSVPFRWGLLGTVAFAILFTRWRLRRQTPAVVTTTPLSTWSPARPQRTWQPARPQRTSQPAPSQPTWQSGRRQPTWLTEGSAPSRPTAGPPPMGQIRPRRLPLPMRTYYWGRSFRRKARAFLARKKSK